MVAWMPATKLLEHRRRAVALVEDDPAVVAAQAHVDVAGVALALVELGHEGERLAVLRGDLLGAVLVDRVLVGGSHHLVVLEGDLVLAEVALALGRLDDQPGAEHAVADVAQQRLDPAGAEQRVVHVVLVRRGEVAVAGGPGLLVGVVEDDELELGAGEGDAGPARRRARPGPAGSAAGSRRRRCARRPARPGRTMTIAVPGIQGTGCRVSRSRTNSHVAVAALPRADGVAVDGVHVDVDGQQVVAALGAVLEHGVEEELGVDPLALQPALHVGEGDDDGVDGRRRRTWVAQLLDGQGWVAGCVIAGPLLIREGDDGTTSDPAAVAGRCPWFRSRP